jgi:hypothetical protein
MKIFITKKTLLVIAVTTTKNNVSDKAQEKCSEYRDKGGCPTFPYQ